MLITNATVINVNGTKFEIAQVFGKSILRIRKDCFGITVSARLPKDKLIRIGKSIVESKKWREIKVNNWNKNENVKFNLTVNATTVFFYSPYCPHCKEVELISFLLSIFLKQ